MGSVPFCDCFFYLSNVFTKGTVTDDEMSGFDAYIFSIIFDLLNLKYNIRKQVRKRRNIEISGGRLDYYCHYWIWQRNKRKRIISFFESNM